jgi:GTP-binding protein
VDATQEDPGEAYRTVRGELEAYGEGLDGKREIVALNKIDALTEDEIEDKAKLLEEACGKPVKRVSGVAGDGVRELCFQAWDIVLEERAERSAGSEEGWAP